MLQYLLKFSISLAVLYIFYRAVLRPLTFYQWNRFYLLCYSLLSFVIPFVDITSWMHSEKNKGLVNIIPAITSYNYTISQPAPAEVKLSLLQRLTVTDWLLIIFVLGVLVMTIKLIIQYLSLRNIRNKAVLIDTSADVKLYETMSAISPFSFGNAIYFNRQLHTDDELQRIIQHEFVHVKQKHTIDLLVGEMLCVVNWFNPFAWFIRYSIRQNLEFIADNNVVANGLDKKEYQYLLLKVLGVPQYSIANNFNFSNLKKRIAMMNKMKSAKLHLTKFLFVLPLMVVLLLAFRKSDHKISAPVAPNNIRVLNDTIPPPPVPIAPPGAKITMDFASQPVNQQGYILSIADNHGECIVVIKDKSQKIVKAQSLAEWNKDKEANESQYGKIPSPPPPPPQVNLEFAPADQPLAPVTIDFAPAVSSDISITENLPADVSGIVTSSNIDKKKGTKTNTATVTLKNGKKEIYNLNKPDEKAKFMEKYGKQPEIRFDTVPGTSSKRVSYPAVSGMSGFPESLRPLYVIDGFAQAQDFDIRKIDANGIESITVLKAPEAVVAFGEKAGNGAILVKMRKYSLSTQKNDPQKIESVSVMKDKFPPVDLGYKAQAGPVQVRQKRAMTEPGNFPKDILVIIDDKEMPAGTNPDVLLKPDDIEVAEVFSGADAIARYGEKGRHNVIDITTKKYKLEKKANIHYKADSSVRMHFDQFIVNGSITGTGNESIIDGVFSFETKTERPLVVFDGHQFPEMITCSPRSGRYRMVILNANEAITKYGDKGKNGAVEITTLTKEKAKQFL